MKRRFNNEKEFENVKNPKETKIEEIGKREEPNYKPSGLLAKEASSINGIELKYTEPPESRLPKEKWRLYVFKKEEQKDVFYLSKKSAFLIGRDRLIVDIPTDHSSCSKQHAVIQFRTVQKEENTFTKPYLIDLESTNGTFINDTKIKSKRYYELRHQDVIRFGESSRDYVLIKEDIE